MWLVDSYVYIKERSFIKTICWFLKPLSKLFAVLFLYYYMIVVLLSILPSVLSKYLGIGEDLIKLLGFCIIALGPLGILLWIHWHYKTADGKSILLKYETIIKWWCGDVVLYFSMFIIFYFSYNYTIFGYTFDAITNNDLVQILITPNKDGVVGIPYLVAAIRVFLGGLAWYETGKTINLVNSGETAVKENNPIKKSKRKRK